MDSAALYLERNGSSGVDEYDASHAQIIDCKFVGGQYGIQDVGGCAHVWVKNNQFYAMSTAAIINTSTAQALPLNWHIEGNTFPSDDTADFGNATHIDMPLNGGVVIGNFFGLVRSTAKYVDLTGGQAGNIVAYNVMAGNYATDDYVAVAGDYWYQNACKVTATTAPDGVSILVPAA